MSAPRLRRILVALFAVYLVLLAWVVLWKLHLPAIGRDEEREIKLLPFLSAGSYGINAPFELGANLLLFVPFGVYLGALLPRWRWGRVALVAAGASVTLEVAQYVLATGSSDTADVLLNTAGALAGFGMLTLARRRRSRPGVLVIVMAVGTALAIAVAAVVIASFPELPPPGDDGVVIVAPARSGGAQG